MNRLLIGRKFDNSEFEVTLIVTGSDNTENLIKGLCYPKKVLVDEIIKEISIGIKYFTKNNLVINANSIVEVKDGDERGPYLSSIANDGVTDNINELPIYK